MGIVGVRGVGGWDLPDSSLYYRQEIRAQHYPEIGAYTLGGRGSGGVATFRCTAGRKFEHSTTPEVGVYKNCFVVVVCIVRTTWVFGDVPKTQTQLALPLWLVLGVQRRGALN